ncbi:MAG TPA: PLP-dependent aminotransferase family protein [Candidatus Angelobacter sp.]
MMSTEKSTTALHLAPWTKYVSRSMIQDLLPKVGQPDVISFGLGLPAPELFPSAEFAAACTEVLAMGPKCLQYGPPPATLKGHIVSLMADRGVECNEKQVFLTQGAQQAVRLLVDLLMERNRQVIMEEFGYPGFQQIVSFYQPEVLSVTSDLHTGMDVDKVEWYLSHGARPAFIYTIPTGHNPLAISLSAEKRERLASLSLSYGVPVLEEDPYGFLTYSTTSLPPIAALATGAVFYIGSFSKILAPSMRMGWLVVPEELIPYLGILKESSDIDMGTFSQYVVARMLDTGFLPDHLRRLRSEYLRRRDIMLEALPEHLPAGSRWAVPDSGMYVWVQMPEQFDTASALDSALKDYRVAYMPGQAFTASASPAARSTMRLNFTHPSADQMVSGIRSLGEMFRAIPNQRPPVAGTLHPSVRT